MYNFPFSCTASCMRQEFSVFLVFDDMRIPGLSCLIILHFRSLDLQKNNRQSTNCETLHHLSAVALDCCLVNLFQKQTLHLLNRLLLWQFFFKTKHFLIFFPKRSIKDQEKTQKNTNETEKGTPRKLNSSLSFLEYSLQSLICVGLFLILKKCLCNIGFFRCPDYPLIHTMFYIPFDFLSYFCRG